MRKGNYGIYKNKEFSIRKTGDQIRLKSTDPNDIQLGFSQSQNHPELFFKYIHINELENAYEIVPYTIFKGHKFLILGFDKEKNKVHLVTQDPEVVDFLEVKSIGKFEYVIEVPIGELQIFEEKRPILGFNV